MINKKHVYNFFLFLFLIFPFFTSKINSKENEFTYNYDYINILDKGPKTDITYIFNEDINERKNLEEEQYSKLVDDTFPVYQSLFFTDLQTITPLYDQSIRCLFPVKKEISFNNDLYINKNYFHNDPKIKIIPTNLAKIFLKPLMNIFYIYKTNYFNWHILNI